MDGADVLAAPDAAASVRAVVTGVAELSQAVGAPAVSRAVAAREATYTKLDLAARVREDRWELDGLDG